MDATKVAEYKEKCRHVIETIQEKSGRLTANFAKVDEIFANYEVYKKHIHKNMGSKDDLAKTEPLMDNHKIAAAFFCSFLKARPLTYVPNNSGVPPNGLELWPNELGAFLFGLQVVQDFWRDKFNDCVETKNKEIYKNIILCPKTDKDSYINWFIRLVVDGMEKYFDFDKEEYEEKLIFFIAHIYYMLEEYSFQYYKAQLYESRSDYLTKEIAAQKAK